MTADDRLRGRLITPAFVLVLVVLAVLIVLAIDSTRQSFSPGPAN
jgi:hypothetical protein